MIQNSNLFKQIQQGSEQINKQIKTKDLIYEKSTKKLKEKQHAIPHTHVDGYYVWHWYGFEFVMDGDNAGIFSAVLGQGAAVLTGGAAIGAIFVLGATAATLAYWSSEASEGAATKRGAVAYYFGDPSWAQLYSVSAR